MSTERQQSVINSGGWILYTPRALQRLVSIIKAFAIFISNIFNVHAGTPKNELQQSINRVSIDRQLSANRASTILGVASCIIQGLHCIISPESKYWPLLWEIWLESILLRLKISINWVSAECQQFWALHYVQSKCYATPSIYSENLATISYSTVNVNFATLLIGASTEL